MGGFEEVEFPGGPRGDGEGGGSEEGGGGSGSDGFQLRSSSFVEPEEVRVPKRIRPSQVI